MQRGAPLRRFAADERGSFAVIAACMMTLVIGCAALGVDLGTIFADRRKTQSAADLAALVAATNLANAINAAKTTVNKNDIVAETLGVELGVYTASKGLAPQARFAAASTPANAVRVTLHTKTPLTFARFLTGADTFTIRTTATAARTTMASFSIGTRVASLNAGLLNALLGGMLGTSLSLSVADYNALLSTKVDLFSTLSALATRVNLTGADYNTVLAGAVSLGDAFSAIRSSSGASVVGTLNTLIAAVGGMTTKIALAGVADPGPYGALVVGQQPKVGISVSALDLVTAIAQVANGTRQIALAPSLNLPGIASLSAVATVGERPVGTSWLTVGPEGASVHTAQTRVFVTINLIGSGSASLVSLPIYIEVGAGTATLKTVACSYPDAAASTVTLGVTPGLLDANVGNVTAAAMANFTTRPSVGAATLVNAGAVSVVGRAHAEIGNATQTAVLFGPSDIASQTKKTVTTTDFTTSLMSSLLGDLVLTLNLGPLALPIPGLTQLVFSVISGATASIDQALAAILGTLGVGVGQADVWVNGVRCDGAVLVN